MSVLLPWTRIRSVAPRPRLFSGTQEGTLGGADLSTPRMGDRFAADVTTAQLRQDAASRELIARLMEGTTADVRIALNLPNASRAFPAGVVVDGANQAGSALAVRGLPAGVGPGWGDFFSVVHGGRSFTFMARAAAPAGSNGRVTIPIWPMLRFLTIDGESVTAPVIEGRLVGFDGAGATFAANRVEPIKFAIEERR